MTLKLSDWGERKIIAELARELDIGDDAAFQPLPGGGFLLFSTDALHERTHRLPTMSLLQFGKLAVTVNLSDIAAMGARPLAFLLSYSSPDLETEKFREIIRGVKAQCRKFNVKFAGGDTSESPGGELALVGSAWGYLEKPPVLRSTAQIADLIGVTGTLSAGLAIEALSGGKKVPPGIAIKAIEPQPRVAEGQVLGKYAHSLTDISDSLAVSLHYLSAQSTVGMRIDVDKLPLPERSLPAIDHGLYSGGDYELLFTFPKKNLALLKKKITFSVIGEVITAQQVTGICGGREIKIKNRGYEHFSRKY